MKKLLWVGDAACPSGFARATHGVLDTLLDEYEVTVLGINYRGDPHPYRDKYEIWPAVSDTDYIGIGRLVYMCDIVKPDVIVIQNDGWNIPHYIQKLRQVGRGGKLAFPEYEKTKVVAVVPVDGKNFQPGWLNGVDHTVFWSDFALDEARSAGFDGCATVIPLGVDASVFHPMSKKEARFKRGLPPQVQDVFIVGNVNRNQPRKRWDLTIKYFAEWAHGGKPLVLRRDPDSLKVKDAFLFLHVAPTGDMGCDIKQLAAYYKVFSRLILVAPPVWHGVSDEEMMLTYNCFDLAISTSQGEGFGLTALEAAACGVALILPDNSALGDWAKDAAWLVPCTSTEIGPPYVNVIGAVPDEKEFVHALTSCYQNRSYIEQNAQAALERATEQRFTWSRIGDAFKGVLAQVLAPAPEETPCEV